MMHKHTETIVQAALEADPATKNKVGQVMLVLSGPSYLPKLISETRAAEMMGVSQATLNIWRREGRKGEGFPFSVTETCGRLLYDENEVVNYIQKNTKKGSLSHEA